MYSIHTTSISQSGRATNPATDAHIIIRMNPTNLDMANKADLHLDPGQDQQENRSGHTACILLRSTLSCIFTG